MTAMLLRKLVWTLLAVLLGLQMLERFNPNPPPLPLVHAALPTCPPPDETGEQVPEYPVDIA